MAAAPGLQQGVGQQRQPARLVRDLVQQPCRQRAFDDQAAEGGGPDDGLAQFVGTHGRNQQCGVLGGLGEPAVAGEMAVEVRAYGDHDAGAVCGGVEEPIQEAGPLVGVGAEGEEFLELVDHDQGRLGRQGLGVGPGGVRARGEDVGPPARPRDQTGAQQGGLAAAGGADEDDDGVVGDHPGEPLDQPVAAEEPLAVTGVEPRQSQVRGLTRVVGGPAFLGRLVGCLLPAPLPVGGVAVAGGDIGEGDLEGGPVMRPRPGRGSRWSSGRVPPWPGRWGRRPPAVTSAARTRIGRRAPRSGPAVARVAP